MTGSAFEVATPLMRGAKPILAELERSVQSTSVLERNLLGAMTCHAGHNTCAAVHASTLNRVTASQPAQAVRSLLQLQRQYGNRYVERMVAMARKTAAHDEVSADVEQAINGERGGGQALDSGVRLQMEAALGADFGGVRVHAGDQAHMLNRELNAQAFTTGQDIFFRQGTYEPGTTHGRELIAHELTHVVQQSGGSVSRQLTVSQPGDAHEAEAEHMAHAIIRQEHQPHLARQNDEKEETAMAARDAEVQRQPESVDGDEKKELGLMTQRACCSACEQKVERTPDQSIHRTVTPEGAGNTRRKRPSGGLKPKLLRTAHISRTATPGVIQRSPTTDTGFGLNAVWTPFARVAAPPFDQTTNFDTDGFHEEFNVPPKSSGQLILLADVAWTSGGGGPGPNPVPPKPDGPSDVCKVLQTVTKPVPFLNQAITLACNTNDPAAVIDSLNDAQLCALAALLGLGVGGILCVALVAAGAAESIRNLIKDLLGIPRKKPGPGPNPSPNPAGATGKGRATFETRFFVGIDGKIQVVGLPPRVSASGSGAELVSPVDFIRTEIPDGVNIAFQPMLKGATAGQTNVFQHQWDVDLKKPAPPPPLPIRYGLRLFPFKTGKEFFEDEGAAQSRLLAWFQSMDPRVFNRITTRQIPVGVAGHASHLGDEAFNLALSERRAKRVQQMVNDFGGSFAGVVTFAFGELLAGGGKDDNSGLFRRADVGVCSQLEGADAAGGPLLIPAENDQTLCGSIGPKAPVLPGGAAPVEAAKAESEQ